MKYIEYKTQVQCVREKYGVTVHDMAQAVVNLSKSDIGSVGHIERVISRIESRGLIACPRPRKVIELKAIAKWLTEVSGVKYLPEHLLEDYK